MFLLTLITLHGAGVLAAPQIASGGAHALAVQADGRLVSWGDNSNGQLGYGKILLSSTPIEVSFPSPVVAVAASSTHVLALDSLGKVWSWGTNASGQLGDGTIVDRSQPAIVFQGAVQIANGRHSSLALDQSGAVWEWGYVGKRTPQKIAGLPSVVKVFAAGGTMMVIDGSGSVWGWGDGQHGKLGFGRFESSATPRMIPGLSQIQHLGIGRTHVIAADINGAVWGWGNASGINGTDYNTFTYLTPTRLTGLPTMAKVDVGSWENYGIGTDGNLYRWYENPAAYHRMTQQPVTFADLSVGDYHGLAMDQSGNAWGWGSNSVGQLGTSALESFSKLTISGEAIGNLSASDYFSSEEGSSFFATASGRLFGQGTNSHLQFALPPSTDLATSSVPIRVDSLGRSVVSVVARRETSFAILSDGSAYGWGSNAYCEIGGVALSQCSPSPAPVKVSINAPVRKISYGGLSTLALDDQGFVWSWGYSFSGLARSGDSTVPAKVPFASGITDIARGLYFAAVVNSAGTVWTWGLNYSGQLGNGTYNPSDLSTIFDPAAVPGLPPIAQLGAGQDFTLALDRNGAVWGWGANSSGQLGFNTQSAGGNYRYAEPVPKAMPLTRAATSIAVGENDACAILDNGDAKCYGGQFDSANGWLLHFESPIIAITLSLESAYFQLADGTVRSMGGGRKGQLGDGTFVQHRSPVLVVNASVNGFLNLKDGTVIDVPPELRVPFFVVAAGEITNTVATVSTTVKFNPPDVGKSGAVFVTAMVPVGTLVATQPSSIARSVARSVSAPAGFVLVQLTTSGWQQVVNGQLIPYASGVLGDQLAAQTILNGTDTTALKGAAFCLGYGSNAAEMIAAGTMRAVATIPDPNATGSPQLGCIVPAISTANAFTFSARAGVPTTSVVASDPITVAGINVSVPISVSGGEYNIDGGSFTNAAGIVSNGQSVTVRLVSPSTFQTTTSATLTIGGRSSTFSITTMPAVRSLDVSQSSLQFAGQAKGVVSAAQSVTLTSTGTAPVNIGGIATSADFASTTTCGASLAPGSNCGIFVTFASAATGARSGTMTISSDAIGSPHSVSLGGLTLDSVTAVTTASTTTVATTSTTTQATTLPTQAPSVTLSYTRGWNLLGNSLSEALPVASLFGDPNVVNTVWKWDAPSAIWQFYTPMLDAAGLQAYAADKGYGVLLVINPGEGFWINARGESAPVMHSGTSFSLGAANLLTGWNLVATGDDIAPASFNAALKMAGPGTGVITLWAWDAQSSKWYFYAPSLEAQGGSVLADFIATHHYLDFTQSGKTLGKGTGFWVNRP